MVEISHSDLHAVFLHRGQEEEISERVYSVTIPWREEAQVLNSEKGLQEVSRALSKLEEQESLVGVPIHIVLGGAYCVTKALRGTNEDVKNELAQIEQRSRLYLSLGPGEKVTVKHKQALNARHEHAIAAVCNKNTLDTIVKAAAGVGLSIDSIEPALVSSTRAVGRLEKVPDEPYLLIHLDRTSVELGICYQGSLLLDYHPGGRKNPKEVVDLIRTHKSRLQRHVGRLLHETPPSLKRVFLCGEKTAVEEAFKAFEKSTAFDAVKIDPLQIQATWIIDKASSDELAIPALGALLCSYLEPSQRDAPNFMEHVIASTQEPIKPVLIASLLPTAAVLLITIGLAVLNWHRQSKIDELQNQVDSLATAQLQARELRLKQGAAEAKVAQLRALKSSMRSLATNEIVERIGHCMPSDVWLSRLVIDDMQAVQLTGASYLEAGVFDFVRWLEQAPGFQDVALHSTQPGRTSAGPAIDFDIELSLADSDDSIREVASNE